MLRIRHECNFAEVVAVREVTNFQAARRVKRHWAGRDEVNTRPDLTKCVNHVAFQVQHDTERWDDFQHKRRGKNLEERRILNELARVVDENLLAQWSRHGFENFTLVEVSLAEFVVIIVPQLGFRTCRQLVAARVFIELHHHLVVPQCWASHALNNRKNVCQSDAETNATDNSEECREDSIKSLSWLQFLDISDAHDGPDGLEEANDVLAEWVESLKDFVLIPRTNIYIVPKPSWDNPRDKVEASSPVNADDPVQQQLERLKILLIEVKALKHPLTISDECREPKDAKKRKDFDEIKFRRMLFEADEEADEEWNVRQAVKGEQTAKISQRDFSPAQHDLLTARVNEKKKISTAEKWFIQDCWVSLKELSKDLCVSWVMRTGRLSRTID